MVDIIDNVNANIEEQLARQISKQRAKKNEPCLVIGNTHYCIDCDNEINPLRIKHLPNASRCIDCQAIAEHKGKHFGR